MIWIGVLFTLYAGSGLLAVIGFFTVICAGCWATAKMCVPAK